MATSRNIFILFAVVALSGCYQFETPPFDQSNMVPIEETALGKAVIAARGNFPKSEQTEDIGKSLDATDMVYEIAPSLLVGQDTKKGGTQLVVMMKNEHHIMVCTLTKDEDRKSAPGVQIKDGNGPFDPQKVVGDATAVRKWAEDYVVNGPKVCLAVPFADARNVKAEESSWFSKLFG